MRKWIILFILIIVCNSTFFISETNAEPSGTIVGDAVSDGSDEESPLNAIPIYENCPRFMGEEKLNEKLEDFKEYRASITEKYTLDFASWLWNMFGLNTLSQLIFGNPFCVWGDGADVGLTYGIFPSDILVTTIQPMFNLFMSAFTLLLVLAIMITGLRASYSFVGSSKFSIGEQFTMYFFAAFSMTLYWWGIDYLFMFNDAIVQGLTQTVMSQGVSMSSIMLATADKFYFVDILLLLMEWVLTLFLNFVYLLRLASITVLMMVGGAAILCLLFERTRVIFKYWLLALCGHIFMQSVHALYFAIVLLFLANDQAGVFFKIFLMVMFLPISSMMMGMLQMSDALSSVKVGQQATTGAALAMRFAKGGMSGAKNRKGPSDLAQLGKTKISTTASGNNSPMWNLAKSSAGIAGSVTGAAAGMVIGGGGAALGGMVGGSIAQTALQAPRNIAGGVKGIMDTRDKFKDKDISKVGGNIQDRREYFGSMGESVGALVGQGGAGRTVGQSLSGVSQQRLLNSDESGGFGGVTLRDIADKYPDAKIEFQQTNEGSGFYMERDGQMQQISPSGAADPTLQDGATRTIPFSRTEDLPNANEHVSPNYWTAGGASINDQHGNSFADTQFNSSSINPDNFYRAGMQGAENRTASDSIADILGRGATPDGREQQ